MDYQQHPVPQNVTNFEFHLVGDMTLKQFLYLASGLGTGYLTYVLFASAVPFFAYPFIFCVCVIGIAFAFLPIYERPLDHWVKSYFNAIFTPTQRQFAVAGIDPAKPGFDDRLQTYLMNLQEGDAPIKIPAMSGALSQSAPLTQAVISTVLPDPQPTRPSLASTAVESDGEKQRQQVTPPAPQRQAPPPMPVPPRVTAPQPPQVRPQPTLTPPPPVSAAKPDSVDLGKIVEYAKEAQILQSEIVEYQKQLNEIKARASRPGVNTQDEVNKFQQVVGNLQKLNSEATLISKQLATVSNSNPKPASTNIKVIAADTQPTEKFVTLTTTPNLINGVVSDAMGNYLVGVIVVTHDKDGMPVRALKTNKLGQFLAATPLSEGTYTLTLEKDNLSFDIIQITLDGSVLPPIKISAKKGADVVPAAA